MWLAKHLADFDRLMQTVESDQMACYPLHCHFIELSRQWRPAVVFIFDRCRPLSAPGRNGLPVQALALLLARLRLLWLRRNGRRPFGPLLGLNLAIAPDEGPDRLIIVFVFRFDLHVFLIAQLPNQSVIAVIGAPLVFHYLNQCRLRFALTLRQCASLVPDLAITVGGLFDLRHVAPLHSGQFVLLRFLSSHYFLRLNE